jgi:hypothetical protein
MPIAERRRAPNAECRTPNVERRSLMTCFSRRTIDRPGERRRSPGEWRLALRASLTFLQTCRHQDSLSALAELRAWRQGGALAVWTGESRRRLWSGARVFRQSAIGRLPRLIGPQCGSLREFCTRCDPPACTDAIHLSVTNPTVGPANSKNARFGAMCVAFSHAAMVAPTLL